MDGEGDAGRFQERGRRGSRQHSSGPLDRAHWRDARRRRTVAAAGGLPVHPPAPRPLRRDRRHGHRPPQPLPAVPRGGPRRLPPRHRPPVHGAGARPGSTPPCSRPTSATAGRCASTTWSTSTSLLASATRTTFQMAYLLTRRRRRRGDRRDGPRHRHRRRPPDPPAGVAGRDGPAVTPLTHGPPSTVEHGRDTCRGPARIATQKAPWRGSRRRSPVRRRSRSLAATARAAAVTRPEPARPGRPSMRRSMRSTNGPRRGRRTGGR